jgi:hypothetical protein
MMAIGKARHDTFSRVGFTIGIPANCHISLPDEFIDGRDEPILLVASAGEVLDRAERGTAKWLANRLELAENLFLIVALLGRDAQLCGRRPDDHATLSSNHQLNQVGRLIQMMMPSRCLECSTLVVRLAYMVENKLFTRSSLD